MLNRLNIFNKAPTNHGTYRAVAGDVVVAESADTQQLEGNQYFPPDAIHWNHFDRSDRTSVCPWKGVATYYDVVVDGERYPAAAWTYETPSAAAESIKDHVAFWHGVKVRRD